VVEFVRKAKSGEGPKRMEFPPNLNAYERQLVHAIAEEIGGVKHESHG
jgi:predicted RNA-binding protein Jag